MIPLRTYPQSYKDTERRCEQLSARSYSSTTPLLHPTARICWSGATEAHIASSVFNHLSALMESVRFKPFLLIEHTAICPREFNTISKLNSSDNSSWIMAEFPEQSWVNVAFDGLLDPSEVQRWHRSWNMLENWNSEQDKRAIIFKRKRN